MSPASERDGLAVWCGWVMVGLAVLTAPFGWLFYQGFSVLIALAGLLCLPALRINEADRPVAVVLLAALLWAAISTLWSPYHPELEDNQGLKLTGQLVFYWAAWCAARRAAAAVATSALPWACTSSVSRPACWFCC